MLQQKFDEIIKKVLVWGSTPVPPLINEITHNWIITILIRYVVNMFIIGMFMNSNYIFSIAFQNR